VSDPDGATPTEDSEELEEVDPDDIEGLREMMSNDEMPPGPVPHQPWRLGETAGCEAPISADWRQQAEEIIYMAAELVGGRVLDVTWFLTTVAICIDPDTTQNVDSFLKARGPIIDTDFPTDGPMYQDPNDPNPEVLWGAKEVLGVNNEPVYVRETEEEEIERKEKEQNMYAKKDRDDPDDEPHIPGPPSNGVSLFMNEESREDAAAYEFEQEREQWHKFEPNEVNIVTMALDTEAMSTIAGAILEALEEYEEKLDILNRHEVVLTSPPYFPMPEMLETQKQFDINRGNFVIVDTQDPFDSNRILKGTLLERNAMDVIINQKGRVVTIPNNFVACVRQPIHLVDEEKQPISQYNDGWSDELHRIPDEWRK